ncbi:tetratricopeptide repeat protein [Sorangium atrum]|uniref:Outer membrane protein assembly factor BamD n=1 Tax=Sorangium atrum TaxID=2995308 RepID=A0ABT5C2J3_9BACT|nr:tetratricopeptide repeat protein [Sorangium aterium]MDC0680623.1 outer membrane protein assembly factor BamD [Sorangium aterium]
MGDPERLLSVKSGADSLERELLGSVRHVGPPEGAKERAWRGIAGQLAAGTAVGATAGASAAAATKAGVGSLLPSALSVKAAAVLVGGGLVLGVGYWALSSPDEAPAPPRAAAPEHAPAEVPQAPVAPLRLEEPKALPEPPLNGPTAGESTRRPSGPKPTETDLLRAESALLTEARAKLRSGDVAGATALLERLRAQFPNGVLRQEREVLAIDVLAARGNTQEAKRRAQAFVKQYPKSPHSAKLRRLLDQP